MVLTTLIEYAVATYGRGRLPVLVTDLGQYNTWDILLPAVYGLSPAEFIEFPGGFFDNLKTANRAFYDAVQSSIAWGRYGAAEEVADAVVFLASARASWLTGICLRVDGGQVRANL